MKKLQIIMGSTRPGRTGKIIAQWAYRYIQQETHTFTVELVDIDSFNLPLFDELKPPAHGQYEKPHTKKWSAKIAEADAYIFVTAEYNHSIPGALKNAMDYLYKEWNNKPFGIISYGSAAGGARAAEHLRLVGAELQMASVRQQVIIPNVWEAVQPDGSIKNHEAHEGALDIMLRQLESWAEAFHAIRLSDPVTSRQA